jgi:hypothetical protein
MSDEKCLFQKNNAKYNLKSILKTAKNHCLEIFLRRRTSMLRV